MEKWMGKILRAVTIALYKPHLVAATEKPRKLISAMEYNYCKVFYIPQFITVASL